MNKSRPPPSLKILPSPNLNAIVLSRGDATWLNKVHKHEIWKGKDGRWCSYVNTNDGKRKVIRKATLDELQQALLNYYIVGDAGKKSTTIPTLKECFYLWLNSKLEYREICFGTRDRYISEFKRFMGDTIIIDVPVNRITEDVLETTIRQVIARQRLTAKAYSNMRTLIMGTFKHARHLGYTDISISSFFKDMELSRRAFAKTQKKTQVFSEDELPKIIGYLKEHPTVTNLGLLLVFQTGIREGELSALKFSDVKGDYLHICRQEIKYKSEKGFVHEIVDYTKSDAGDRMVILTSKAKETISQIKKMSSDNDYMMTENGRHVWTNSYNDRLYKVCDALGIERRSMHKIRKTYATLLLDADTDESLVMSQLGHSDIATTRKYYYFSDKNSRTKQEQINKAIDF